MSVIELPIGERVVLGLQDVGVTRDLFVAPVCWGEDVIELETAFEDPTYETSHEVGLDGVVEHGPYTVHLLGRDGDGIAVRVEVRPWNGEKPDFQMSIGNHITGRLPKPPPEPEPDNGELHRWRRVHEGRVDRIVAFGRTVWIPGHISSDGGATWTPIEQRGHLDKVGPEHGYRISLGKIVGLPWFDDHEDPYVQEVLVHDGRIFAASIDDCWVSTDEGVTFERIEANYAVEDGDTWWEGKAEDLRPALVLGDRVFAIGKDQPSDGVFVLHEEPRRWLPLGLGLYIQRNKPAVFELAVSEGFLLAATSVGVFRRSLATLPTHAPGPKGDYEERPWALPEPDAVHLDVAEVVAMLSATRKTKGPPDVRDLPPFSPHLPPQPMGPVPLEPVPGPRGPIPLEEEEEVRDPGMLVPMTVVIVVGFLIFAYRELL